LFFQTAQTFWALLSK